MAVSHFFVFSLVCPVLFQIDTALTALPRLVSCLVASQTLSPSLLVLFPVPIITSVVGPLLS